MNALKTVYDDIPPTIRIPKEFVHKKGEIIILIDEPNDTKQSEKNLSDFFGSIPDFPDRAPQGDYDERESL